MQEQELFQGYEIKNWDFNPRVYKILAASAIFNVLALLVVAQSNLLTRKGCESPLVGGVCQVIDMLVVGNKILSADSTMGESDYIKTELENAEIIWIDQTGAEKFQYPENYFALANPEKYMPQEIPGDNTFPDNIPGFQNQAPGGTDLMTQPQVLPQDNPNAVSGKLPDSPFSINENPTLPRKNRPGKVRIPKNPTLNNNSPTKLPDLNNNQTADKNTNKKPDPKVTPTPNSDEVAKEDENGIYKNKKPLKDFALNASPLVKTVKLDAPFTATIAADLDLGKDGKTVVLKNPKQVKPDPKTPNDPQMAKLAQDAILAIGDSGWLGYLKTLGVKKVVFTLSQDDAFMTAKIQGEQKDENTAKTTASGLNGFISIGKSRTDGDEKLLLEGAKATSEGNLVILNFAIPKQIALEMITRKLKESEQNQTEVKPQSTAQVKETNQTSAK